MFDPKTIDLPSAPVSFSFLPQVETRLREQLQQLRTGQTGVGQPTPLGSADWSQRGTEDVFFVSRGARWCQCCFFATGIWIQRTAGEHVGGVGFLRSTVWS